MTLALYHFGPVANSFTPLLCLLEKGIAARHARGLRRRSGHRRMARADGGAPTRGPELAEHAMRR